MADFDFSGLDPDTILNAMEGIGIFPRTGLLALNSYENRVYQFQDDDGRRLVTKFYRPQRWSDQAIQEEHTFAYELANDDIPVVAPLTFDGKTLLKHEQFRFSVFPSVGGRQFEADNLDQLEWMGRFIGRIHQVSRAKDFSHRPTISVEDYLDTPRKVLSKSQLVPQNLHTALFAILDPVIDAVKTQYVTETLIRLHGDCHAGNILWRDGPTFVDLDDCRRGPAIQDLWMMLSGDRYQQQLQLETLIEAYEEFCEFNPAELKLIEPLRAMRMVHYMAWLSNRWQDPAFPRAFPWFAEQKYWEGQVLALKEQLAALNEPPLKLTPY
ncbi:serine/threonine protein kinase [Alteromonas sp. ASW11-130]|uniref:serine/threonine protein kinase n=1 Tax=Alteromonas sp. ASW11-130 TaxID=3015775 RepID=UPI00224187A0|nr:serine/threonine protein kinase [Alteromonas sp. ASW11-130]MCW8090524.1 serine/threonine protein kinase [Alteromonas sp. ASW11-130]